MNSKILVITALIVLVILVGITFISTQNKNKTTAQVNTQTNTKAQNNNESSMTVLLTANGYEPAEIKIKAGAQIVWTNKSGSTATVNSDNHPAHLLWPFLNLGTFKNGETVSVVFDKAGTYTYHNHFNPTQKGKVIVE